MTQHDEMRELFEREAAWLRREALPIPPIEPEHQQLMRWAARYEHLAATVDAVPVALIEAYHDCDLVGEVGPDVVAGIQAEVFGDNVLLTATEYMRGYVSHPHWRVQVLQ